MGCNKWIKPAKTIRCSISRKHNSPKGPITQIVCAPDRFTCDERLASTVALTWDLEDARGRIPSFFWTHIAYLLFGYCAGGMMRGAYCGEFKVVNAVTGKTIFRSFKRVK